MNTEQVKQLILKDMPAAEVFVASDDDVHFSAEIKWDGFAQMSKVKQQQKVYQILSQQITSGQIHALSLKTSA